MQPARPTPPRICKVTHRLEGAHLHCGRSAEGKRRRPFSHPSKPRHPDPRHEADDRSESKKESTWIWDTDGGGVHVYFPEQSSRIKSRGVYHASLKPWPWLGSCPPSARRSPPAGSLGGPIPTHRGTQTQREREREVPQTVARHAYIQRWIPLKLTQIEMHTGGGEVHT